MTRPPKSLLVAAVAILFLPGIASALPPELRVTLFRAYAPTTVGTTFTDSSGSLSRSQAGNNSYGGRVETTASATFGVLRARVTTTQAPHTQTFTPYGSVFARMRDNRVTDAPGRTGQQGYVTVKVLITGSLWAQVSPVPDYDHSVVGFALKINDESQSPHRQIGVYANGEPYICDACTGDFLGIEQTYTYGVTFGTPYDFYFLISARNSIALHRQNTSYNLGANLGNTAVWGGIVSVTDAQGNPITDYTDTSSSGTNYKNAISPVCATPPAAVTGWWPGDNHPRDIDSGNNGVLENGATYATGHVGQAFSFPGSGGRVRVPHAAALDFTAAQDYTVDFWMKAAPQPAAATLVEKNGGTFPYSIRLLPNGTVNASAYDGTSTVSVNSTSGNGTAAAGVVHDNLWHHVAAVFKHSTKTLELYVDGSLNASQTYTETLGTLANGQDLYFGARGDGSAPFIGALDEVDISNGALSLSEIQAIAAAAGLGKCRPPVIATGAVSRKVHGDQGPFDVNLPLTGTTGVESRSGGATGDYQVVATFASPVTVDGATQAQVISGNGVVGSGGASNGGAVSISGNTVTIPLTNVTNAQTLGIQLNSVSNGASVGDIVIPMSVLVGDTSGDRSVNSGDALQTRSRSGQAVTATTFRSDVNADGSINSGDALAVKARSGTDLP